VIRAVALTLSLTLTLVSTAFADDAARVYRTIETEHFRITYYVFRDGRGLEKVAQRLAVIAEETHARLVPLLGAGGTKRRKTEVLVTDETDDFNGSASVLPYQNVRLLANAPEDRAELNDHDDWLRGLFVHEYTHVLHIGTVGGWCAPLVNAVLGLGVGVLYAPNQAQPRFLIEGIAVHEESARTTGGRLRSAIWDMYLRAQTLEGRFMRIDQFSNSPAQFPYSNAPYLYGSAMTRYLVERFGEDAVRKYSVDYGSNCIPLAMNRSLKRVTGVTWNQLYDDFKRDLEKRYRAQRDAIAEAGITPALKLTRAAEYASRPAWTPDGKTILFHESDLTSRPRIKRVPAEGGRKETELQVDGASGPSLSADGRYMVYSAQQIWRTFYAYHDLYLYDRQTREHKRLTNGLRAMNPNLSADGKRVVFEVNDASSRGLGMMDLHDGHVEMLIPATGFEYVYTPVLSPDGKRVAFSWWREGGYRDIWTLEIETKKLTRITEDRAVDMEPRWSPDSAWLYFVSDRTGVYNLYARDEASGEVWQASNVVNGVFDPAISPDGKKVAFVGFVADGYDIEVMDLERRFWVKAPELPKKREEATRIVVDKTLRSRLYNPVRTGVPWTIRPLSSLLRPFSAPGPYGQTLGLQVTGQDLVGHHPWSAQIVFSTGRADAINASINYTYNGLWPSLSVAGARALQRRGGVVLNGRQLGYDEEVWTFATGVTLPIVRRLFESLTLGFSYNLTYTRNLTRLPEPDPSALIPIYPEVGRVAGLGMTFSYSSARRFPYSISNEEGRELHLYLGIGSRYLGGQFDVQTISWRWNEYIKMPWRPRWLQSHVLYLAYSGGIAGGDLRHRGAFYLGGYPEQDLISTLFDFARPGNASLRGYDYASISGDQFHVINVEYRFPIVFIERGVYKSFPIYFRRLHAKVFVDYGAAFRDGFAFDKLKLGVGAELICEIQYFYYFPASLQLSYGYGVHAPGGNQVYFLLNAPF
jgi:hypothetical protein